MYKLCAVTQTHDPSTCIWEMEAEPEESIRTWRPASLVNTGGKKETLFQSEWKTRINSMCVRTLSKIQQSTYMKIC